MKRMQRFVSQPSDKLNGHYVVAEYDYLKEQYFPIEGEDFLTKEDAIERASQLNCDDCHANIENKDSKKQSNDDCE